LAGCQLCYDHSFCNFCKDAQEKGYIGDCKKVWLTAYDERVCKTCEKMDGESVNMDALFSNGLLLPPGHPRCRCGVAYEEVAAPIVPVVETSGALVSDKEVA
jgi:hypothetical protein